MLERPLLPPLPLPPLAPPPTTLELIMDCVLGIDGGGSKTICVVVSSHMPKASSCTNRQVIGKGEAGASNYQSVGIEAAKNSIESAIYQAIQQSRDYLNHLVNHKNSLNISAICLGLAGVGRPKDIEIIRSIVTELQGNLPQNLPTDVNWNISPNNIIICHDALIALVGGIGHDVGIAVAAGTGSIVYGRNQQGKTKRVGGWGYILGDEGGAYKIAVAGMQAALKAYDGRGEATSLVEIFKENLQLTTIEELVEVVYRRGNSVTDIAAIAPLVHNAAKNGDVVANHIIDEAVVELVEATTVVVHELFSTESSPEIVIVGSVWKGESNIHLRFEQCLLKSFPQVKVIFPRYEPAFGAALLALKNIELEQKESGSKEPGLDGRLKQLEDRLFELNARLEQRQKELLSEGSCTITDIRHYGCAWVLPHPERTSPEIAGMVSNEEIERVAVDAVIAYEEARGWKVVSVEKENRGFDLISRQPHPEDPETAIAVRFIEVKGRSTVGQVALTANEYKTAERLKQDYWLYVVFNCAENPQVHPINDPVKLGWEAIVKIEHYHVSASKILNAEIIEK